MAGFTKDDFVVELTDTVAKPMLDVILAFARLDTALSGWLIQAYGMRLDLGALLVENMDLGNKINRLKKLYKHSGKEWLLKTLPSWRLTSINIKKFATQFATPLMPGC